MLWSGDSELQTPINVRVDLEQCVMGQLILKNVRVGRNRKDKKKHGGDSKLAMCGGFIIKLSHYHSTVVPSHEMDNS